jgi:hypothetical protein
MSTPPRAVLLALVVTSAACASTNRARNVAPGSAAESVRVLEVTPGARATIVAPARLDTSKRIDLILYALPNGNSTAETMGRSGADSATWRYDIQHIAAQTRALRTRGLPQAIVVYLEADTKSWPAWRARLGYPRANARIVEIADEIRNAVGVGKDVDVTLTGHSGGGSFIFGFIEGQAALPAWLDRIAFLDAIYNFEGSHGDKLLAWLSGDSERRLVSLAYDDREITLDGKKVVSDSGGTWRATDRMIRRFSESLRLETDRYGDFERHRTRQIELLRHPNPMNRILHTEMIGEMNGYMHALLTGRPEYDRGESLLKPARAYTRFVSDSVPTAVRR